MYFFDLHCDTVFECERKGKELLHNDLAISLEKARNFEKWVQAFAIFIHDKYSLQKQREQFFRQYALLKDQMEKNDLAVFPATDSRSRAVLKTIENASFIGSDFELIEKLASDGFTLATLTWNAANCYAGGADSPEGLTSLGKQAVKKFTECGITIDVSHLSDISFWDVIKQLDKMQNGAKIAASHSNARAVCPHRRNLSDDMLKAIAERSGIIGLNFYTEFLAENDPSVTDILRHAEHILNLCGENAVAIGSDFDGADMPDGLKSVSDIENLYQLMVQYFGKALSDRIFYKNAYDFFGKK